MPSRSPRQGFWAGLILLLSLLGFYGPTLLSEHFLFAGVIQDITNIYGFYPWDVFSGREFSRGHFPLWNPFNGLGVPLLANMQSAPFFPLQWLKYLLGFWTAADLTLLLRLWLAGIFTYFFARRALRLGFGPALLSGLSFMLCGHFTRYVYMSHLNVETLIPFQLLLLHRLAEKPRLKQILAAGAGVFLLIAGGFPEAALYALAVAVAYYLFESLRRGRFWPGLNPLGAALGFGLLLAAPQWLPFAEYLAQAWTYHDPSAGIRHRDVAYAVSLIQPWFFGDNAISTLAPFLVPSLGLVGFGFALRAALSARRLAPRPLFFLALALTSAGIAYGLPPFHLLGYLYPFSITYNDKYAVPGLALAVAILAGQGLELALKDKNPRGALFAGALILVWAVSNLVVALLDGFHPFFGFGAANSFLQTAAALSALALALGLYRRGFMPEGAFILAVLVTAAFSLFQDFRGNRPVPQDDEIFKLPAVAFADNLSLLRVTAEDDLFFPNLLLPQGIADLRSYDPLYPQSYVAYMSALNGFNPESARRHYDEHMLFQVEREKWGSPLCDLAGVAWVALAAELGSEPLAERLIAQGTEVGPFAGWARHTRVNLGKNPRWAVLHHAPDRLETAVPRAEGRSLRFAISAPGSAGQKSAGIWAGITLAPDHTQVYWRYLDPLRQKTTGRWIQGESAPLIDLPPTVTLKLLALPGPQGPGPLDLLAWEGIRLWNPSATVPGFEPVAFTSAPIIVYKNLQARDRAFLVQASAVLPGATRTEKEKSFFYLANEVPALFSSQVLLSEKIEFPWLRTAPPAMRDLPSRILFTEYFPDRVKLICQSPRPAFLTLSDQYFPGWRAWSGGQERRILAAYLAMRALPIAAGETEITFIYQPWSFRIGIWLLIVTGLAAGVAGRFRRKESG